MLQYHTHRTELSYFQIIFGDSCSVITEPFCFWNDFVLVTSVNSELLNPWIYFTEMFWVLCSVMSVESANRNRFGIALLILWCVMVQNWSLEIHQEPSSRPQPQCWTKLLDPWVAIRAAIYRSLRALRAQNRKKVSKTVFWGVRQKVPENTPESQKKKPKKSENWTFRVIF